MKNFEEVYVVVSRTFYEKALKQHGKIMADLQKLTLDAQKPLLKVFFDQGAEMPPAALTGVRTAVEGYYQALSNREHGGVAQDKAFTEIQTVLNMTWDGYKQKEGNKHDR